ncbi:MAG: c-type cytochrome biogenesis protein CcsB [Desulfobacteraceae bacterium]|jgi:cytochrome c-type biogenesis protein CcsB|nr:c-type cytochrome biogenesis protein CcsB [Desulfobacteraceae bacterium]
MTSILFIIILFYLLSSAGYILFLFAQKGIYHRLAYRLMMAGFALHAGLVGYEFFKIGYFPAQNLHQTLLFAAWTLAGVFLVLKHKYRLNILGVYAAPLTTAIMIFALCVPSVAVASTPLFKSLWLVVHIVIIFIAEASLALACGTGILYLIQEHTIKTKNNRFFLKRLPSLEFLDRTGYTFIITGFTMLTIGLITGFVYAQLVWGKFWSWDNKEIWSMITWLIYAALLHGRLVAGWRGRLAAIMAVVGFAALLFTFFGVNFLLEGHHNEFTKW